MNQWRNEWGAKMIPSHGSSNARGVAILLKNAIDCTINHKILDPFRWAIHYFKSLRPR